MKCADAVTSSDHLTQPDPAPDLAHGPGPALMGATTLVGDLVRDHDGNTLGELKDVMLDVRSGRIAYAVLSTDGYPRAGAKLFAVPWRALRLDPVNKRLSLDVKASPLDCAPGFDRDRWPDMADTTWADQVHSYYGTKPYYDRPF